MSMLAPHFVLGTQVYLQRLGAVAATYYRLWLIPSREMTCLAILMGRKQLLRQGHNCDLICYRLHEHKLRLHIFVQ